MCALHLDEHLVVVPLYEALQDPMVDARSLCAGHEHAAARERERGKRHSSVDDLKSNNRQPRTTILVLAEPLEQAIEAPDIARDVPFATLGVS
jgi:hypothetical protein